MSSCALSVYPRHDTSPELAGYVRPVRIHAIAGSVQNAEALLTGTRRFDASPAQCCALTCTDAKRASVTLDYGVVVAGIPVFQVKSVRPEGPAGHVVLKVRYSEALAYVDREEGDGPFPFTAAADTLRVNEYEISLPGPIEHFHIQGGQRWQVIELVTLGSIELNFAGFRPTTYNIDPSDMPGYFECSDMQLNNLWASGARSVQINSIPPRSNTVNWHPTPLGMIIMNQRVSHYVWGGTWTDIVFKFEAKVIKGGLAFSVRSRNGFGPLFQVYTDGSKSKLDLSYGFYNQEQRTLWPTPLDTASFSVDLTSDHWHTWEVVATGNQFYYVKVDGQRIAKFAQSYGERHNTAGKPVRVEPHEGSCGIGTGAGQTAVFRNAVVTSPEGTILYANSLQDASALSDFAVGTNILPVAYDGAKRDRAVWLGDTIVPALALYYSTGRPEFIEGSIEAIMRRQQKEGRIPAYGLAGFPFMDYRPEDEAQPPFNILAGTFTMYVVRICYEHFLHTGDIDFIRMLYPKLQKLVDLIQENVDKRNILSMTGLWAMDSDYYNKPRSGATTKNNSLYIISLGKIAEIAGHLGDYDSQARYLDDAQKTKVAANALLFNEKTGVYDASEDARDVISEDANAFALLADLPPSAAHRSSILHRLRQLYTPGGCISFNVDSGYMETPVVSPIMNAWHAEAALHTPNHFADALQIWRSCWGPMIDQSSKFYTGAHWEFSTPEGTPHMDHFCSLAHPFSALPVYQLGKYGLGIFPTQPGWKTFTMQPLFGFLDLLTYAKGRVPTPAGVLTVSWAKTANDTFTVELSAPIGIEGLISLPLNESGKAAEYQGADDLLVDGGVKCAGGTTVKVIVRY